MYQNYKWQRRAAWFLAVVFMAGSVQARSWQDARDTVKETFKVRSGGTLYIDIDHGNVDIESSRDDAVSIQVERIVDTRDRDDIKKILEGHMLSMEQKGNDVRLRSRFEHDRNSWGRWRDGKGFKVRFTIRVPERFNVDFTNGAGNVAIARIEGRLEGRTGAGNITVGRVQGPVDVSSGSGNIDVDGAVGSVRVNSGAGNVSLGRIEGEVRANTGAGNIIAHIISQPDGDSRLESGAGNVTVYLDDQVSVYVDAQASVGSANCDFPLKVEGRWMSKSFGGRINGGGPELHLRSGVGNVSLKKQ